MSLQSLINLNESEWFDNLNKDSSDDKIINELLNFLNETQNTESPFQRCTIFDDVQIKRIIERLKDYIIKVHDVYGESNYEIQITTTGSEIASNGGWLKYLETKNQMEANKHNPTIVNKNINITGNVTNSQINQDSDLRENSFINTKNTNSSPAKNEAEQSIKAWAKDIFKKYWWGLVIPLILLIIGYLIEYKSGFFIQPNPH